MDWRTASSNSIGPGMSRVGWDGWLDILAGASSAMAGSDGFGAALAWSSSRMALRSVEKGVLSSRNGRASRCPEKRPRRAVGREGARMTNAELEAR
jgi:hypothetical protein